MTAPLAALLLAAAAAVPTGVPPALAGETLPVQPLPAPLPADPAAAAWDALPALEVLAAPQRSIRLHDREANAALAKAAPRRLTVRAATDGRELAVVVDWADATEDRAAPDATDRYGDAVGLQLPLRSGAGVRLPYVGMGDDGEPVALFLARAGAAGATTTRVAVGTGFGTSARRDLGPLRATLVRRAGGWRAVLVRPLAAGGLDLGRALVPFALATWDGAGLERGGNKALTGWKFLRLPGRPLDEAYAAEQAWGRGPGATGDPGRGRTLFDGACTACHATATDRGAAPGLAPDLSEIGLIATPGYLRDSVVAPSAVIVPNPNPAQRQDRTAEDPRAPWPADEGYVWYVREADGRKTSSMPDSAALPAADLADLVAYLMTLGAPAPAGRTP
jgi:complex iron-sulfur molybdoenzyme family reductase subunit gamma